MSNRLLQHAIQVVQPQGLLDQLMPVLYVNINSVSTNGEFVYNAGLEFKRTLDVYVPPEKKNRLYRATVWSREYVGVTRKSGRIEETVQQLMDLFLNDYLTANPKQGAR